MKVTSGNRQAVAFNSFLEASILLGIFEKMPNKIDASKEKYQTYLLPSIRAKNLSLAAMVINFDHRTPFCLFRMPIVEVCNFNWLFFKFVT